MLLTVSRHLPLITCSFIVFTAVGCTNMAHKASSGGADEEKTLSSASGDVETEKLKVIVPEVKTDISSDLLYKLLVAEIAAQRGDLEVSIENYIDVAKASQDVNAVARAAQIANFAQDDVKSMETSKLWVELAPNDAEARQSYAAILLKVGRSSDAIPQFIKMAELLSDTPGKGFMAVTAQLVRVSDRNIAEAVMEKVVENHTSEPEAMFAYGHLLLRLAKFEGALRAFDKALVLKPNWTNAVILKARTLALGKGRDQAIAYLKKTLENDLADNLDVGVSYARMLTENRQFEDALEQFSRLAKLEPRNVEINYLAGVLALQLSHLDVAEKFLKTVVKLGSRLYESNYYLGQIAEQKRDYGTAINRYSTVKRGELYFSAQVRVVALLAEQRQFDRAKEYLHSIRVSSAKQHLQLNLLEGDLLRESGKFADAKDFYSKLLEETPNESSLRYARALIAEKLGDLALVEKDLQTILENEPKNAQVLNALGYTLADQTTRYEEALGYIRRALELEPDDAAVMDSMGWVQYRLGNFEDAINHLKRAASLDEDPEIAAHFGEVLWAAGKQEEAMQIWKKSLKKNPDHEILNKVMKRFNQ